MTRQNAINRLKVMQEYYRKEAGYLSIANVIALDFAISSLKAGARLEKQGKWGKDGHGHVICSVCGNVEERPWRFCRVCGTKMEGDK